MSWATAYENINNVLSEMPGMMNDGRNFATWKLDQDIINKNVALENGIKSNSDYRNYLMKNSKQIINTNLLNVTNNTGKTLTFEQTVTNNPPYLYKNSFDTTTPLGYESSDLKNYYLTRDELNKRLVSQSFEVPDYK